MRGLYVVYVDCETDGSGPYRIFQVKQAALDFARAQIVTALCERSPFSQYWYVVEVPLNSDSRLPKHVESFSYTPAAELRELPESYTQTPSRCCDMCAHCTYGGTDNDVFGQQTEGEHCTFNAPPEVHEDTEAGLAAWDQWAAGHRVAPHGCCDHWEKK